MFETRERKGWAKGRKYLWGRRDLSLYRETISPETSVASVNHSRLLYSCILSNRRRRGTTAPIFAFRVRISPSLESYSNLLLERSSRLTSSKRCQKDETCPVNFWTGNPSKTARRFKRIHRRFRHVEIANNYFYLFIVLIYSLGRSSLEVYTKLHNRSDIGHSLGP